MKHVYQILLTSLFTFSTLLSFSQTYQVEARNEPFVFLDDPESAVSGTWSVPVFAVPIGFEFEFFDFASETIYSKDNSLGGYTSLNTDEEHLYMLLHFYASFTDRGFLASEALSPIYYKTTGPAGNRVFTLEYNNAGFYGGSVSNDNIYEEYISFQIRLFEQSGDIEYHIGPYNVFQDPMIVFEGFTGPFIGMFANSQNYFGGHIEEVILLSGDPSSPTITNNPFVNLEWPIPENTVYRFSRESTSTDGPTLKGDQIALYPNPATGPVQLLDESDEVVFPILIHDVYGNQVATWNRQADMTVSGLASGCYYAIMQTDKESFTKKLVVIKG